MDCQLCSAKATHQVVSETIKTYVKGQYVEIRDPHICSDCKVNLTFQLPGIHFRDLNSNSFEGLGTKPHWMKK